jgi:hypothetical protein
MAEVGWLQLLAAALGGGLTVKLLDIIYQEFRRWSESARSAEQFVDKHLDPLLKAADELVGKLRSLAESDFKELHAIQAGNKALTSSDLASVLFLFGRFWARIEIVRHEGLSVAMGEDARGKKLQAFMDCLESRRVRIVDRIAQRAVGETMIERQGPVLDTMTFIRFVKGFGTDDEMRRWMVPLERVLSRTRHTADRQRLLQYGVVVHALIDTLDPKKLVTRERPSYPNKLSRRSWRDLKYRVFGQYLTFVGNPKKYLGPPK